MADTTQDKMVEIARFHYPADAYALMTLLESEGIDCYLRNENTASLLSHLDTGGARIEILEKEVPRAMEIMEEGGFHLPPEDDTTEKFKKVSGWTSRIPLLNRLPLDWQIVMLLVLVAAVLAILVILSQYFNTPVYGS